MNIRTLLTLFGLGRDSRSDNSDPEQSEHKPPSDSDLEANSELDTGAKTTSTSPSGSDSIFTQDSPPAYTHILDESESESESESNLNSGSVLGPTAKTQSEDDTKSDKQKSTSTSVSTSVSSTSTTANLFPDVDSRLDADEHSTDRLANLRGELNMLARRLYDTNLTAESRHPVVEAGATLMRTADDQLADQKKTPIPNPNSDNSPPMWLFAKSIAWLSGQLAPDKLNEHEDRNRHALSQTDIDISAIRADITQVHVALDAAEELPFAVDELSVESKHGKDLISVAVENGEYPSDAESYAGPYVRDQAMCLPAEVSTSPLWVGTGTRMGKDAPIEQQSIFKHTAIIGKTGEGKTTLLKNISRQLVLSGAGFCFLDPKGDDAPEFIEILPEDRANEIIWIDPGGDSDYVSGFNFISLDVLPPDEDYVGLEEREDSLYENALMNVIDDFVALIGADDYWGPRMDRVSRTILTAMNRYNRANPDQPDMNVLDFYKVLESEASRHEFAARMKVQGIPFVDDFVEWIADELEDVDLEPLLGRFTPWVQNQAARRLIGFRDEELSIAQAVRDNKVVVLRMGSQPKGTKKLLGMALIRRIWAAIKSRAEFVEEGERTPFYILGDEFHSIVPDNETIPTMLAEARSYRLALVIASQNFDQLPKQVSQQLLANTDTKIAFNPGSKAQARQVATELDLDTRTLLSLSPYHIWMRSSYGTERPPAFKLYTYPPFPPVRSKKERDALIKESLKTYGRKKMDATERQAKLMYDRGNGRAETGYGELIAMAEDPEERALLKTDLQAAIRDGAAEVDNEPAITEGESQDQREDQNDETPVKAEAVGDSRGGVGTPQSTASGRRTPDHSPGSTPATGSPRTSRASPGGSGPRAPRQVSVEELTGSKRRVLLEAIYTAQLRAAVKTDDHSVTPGNAHEFDDVSDLPAAPESRVVEQVLRRLGDTGNQSVLGNALEQLDGDLLEMFVEGTTRINLTDEGSIELFSQDTGSAATGGGTKHRIVLRKAFRTFTALGYHTSLPTQEDDEDPDGIGNLPIDPMEASTPQEYDQLVDQLKTETDLWPVSEGRHIHIEAETSTPKSPGNMITNLRKAVDDNRKCIFCCRGDAEKFRKWARKIEGGLYDKRLLDEDGTPTEPDASMLNMVKETDQQGNRVFYNTPGGNYLDWADVTPLRPHGNSRKPVTWREVNSGEAIIAEDNECGEFARFDSIEAIFEGDKSAMNAYYVRERPDRYVVFEQGERKEYTSSEEISANYSEIKEPFVPELQFETPTERISADEYLILIYPDAGAVDDLPFSEPQVYLHGDLVGLSEYVGLPSTALTSAPTSPAEEASNSPPTDQQQSSSSIKNDQPDKKKSQPQPETTRAIKYHPDSSETNPTPRTSFVESIERSQTTQQHQSESESEPDSESESEPDSDSDSDSEPEPSRGLF